ncbi:MAG: hypothetical protein QG566_753, partial [Patescibacteria group bacterium]|nr:hypothetical protein [Patescibacteria group bacterium]
MNITEEIKKFFKGDVDDSAETLEKYSHDASVLVVRPQVVVFPKDSNDVQVLVKWVNQNKAEHPELSITPRAAGTCMSGGAIGESIIMDFTKYMNIVSKVEKVPVLQITPKYPNSHSVEISGSATVMPG